MVKTQNVDTELLDKAIERSGRKTSYICDQLGITRQAFNKKRTGKTAFRKSEVFVMNQLLNLDAEESSKIFC